MKIKHIIAYFTDTVFRRDASEWRSPAARWLVRQYRLLFYTARGLKEHGTLIRSAALTFYTLMSLVPIVAVAFAVVKGFGLADGLVQNLYSIFPQNPEIIDYIVAFAEKALARTQGGVVAVVALVMLFWAVIRVFGSIENAFNNIWEVKAERSIARQWSDYIAIVMIVPVLWVIAGAVGGYARQLLGFGDGWFYSLLSQVMSVVVVWVMFTVFYVVIPNARVRFPSALMAGIVAGTAFALFQWGYLYVQRWMTSYNAIYGSFAALPLFMIWMQTSWQILLFGGERSFASQNVSRFCDRLDLPTRIVNDILYQLVQADLLLAVPVDADDREKEYIPAQDVTSLTVYGVLEAVEQSGNGGFDPAPTPEFSCIDRELERIKQHARKSQENVKIIDLLEG